MQARLDAHGIYPPRMYITLVNRFLFNNYTTRPIFLFLRRGKLSKVFFCSYRTSNLFSFF